MVNIIRTARTSTSPPRNGEVGEIDTRAPFQSVRAAVSLFGMVKAKRPPEKAAVPKKTTPETEGVLDKEAQYHLTQKELDKYKEDLKNAEAVATEALPQLQKATTTLEDLKDKLNVVNESKLAILEVTESLKMKAEMLEESKTNNNQQENNNADILRNHQNVEESRAEYKAAAAELDAAKQQLSKLRSDFNASVEEKQTACNKAEEARTAAQAHSEKVNELSQQIKNLQTSLSRVNRASQNSVQEHNKILADKATGIEIRRKAKEEAENKITALRQEMSTLLSSYDDPESKLAQTHAEIKVVREDVEAAKAALSEAERIAVQELDAAKETLNKVVDEKNSVQAMVNSVETELRNAHQEIKDSKNNEAEAESLAGKLKAELEEKKKELKHAIESEHTTASVSEEITSKVEQLLTKTRKAKEEAEEMRQNAEKVKRGAKNFEEMAVEMRTSLDLVLKEAEEAREADRKAQELLHKTKNEAKSTANDTESSSSPSVVVAGTVVVPTTDEKTLVPAPEKLVNKTAEKVRTEEEMVIGGGLSLDCKSKSEAEEQIDAILKEIDEIKVATGEALKQAEKAEKAQKIVEVELHRRYEQQ